jgi:hypothetical protein
MRVEFQEMIGVEIRLVRRRHADQHLRLGVVHEDEFDHFFRIRGARFLQDAVDSRARRTVRHDRIGLAVIQPAVDFLMKNERQARDANDEQKQGTDQARPLVDQVLSDEAAVMGRDSRWGERLRAPP